LKKIKEYRQQHGCDLATAKRNVNSEASIKYEELTGYKGMNYEAIFHHRLKDWGPECKKCGRLFRTSRASFCANCGQKASEND
jgi:rRNA maturation endonuclease Nob1